VELEKEEAIMEREAARAFALRLMKRVSGATLLGVVGVADRVGLFRNLAGQGALSLEQVVERSGLQERYVREILAALAAGGLVRYDPQRETFELPDEAAACLADAQSPYFLGSWPQLLGALFGAVPGVARACQKGGGVAFSEFGPEWVEAMDRANSPGLRVLLTRKWLPALPELVKRLEAGVRVADVGCGSGTAGVTMAEAYPDSSIVGYDVDGLSIERARAAAREAALPNLRFERVAVESLPVDPPFDLITAFDVIHDLVRPREALRRIREALHVEGTFLMVEPAAGDRLEENLHPLGALFYAMSTLHCTPVSLAHGGEGLGAAWGPARAQALCREAGFTRFQRLAIESAFHAFYEVRP
jgi:SAM-dependent methyltransferase